MVNGDFQMDIKLLDLVPGGKFEVGRRVLNGHLLVPNVAEEVSDIHGYFEKDHNGNTLYRNLATNGTILVRKEKSYHIPAQSGEQVLPGDRLLFGNQRVYGLRITTLEELGRQHSSL